MQSGFEELEPLVEFRDYLARIRSQRSKRMERRRNGAIMKRADGSVVHAGPFTLNTREVILSKLEELQEEMGDSLRLISDKEKDKIREIWAKDKRQYARRGGLSKRGVS